MQQPKRTKPTTDADIVVRAIFVVVLAVLLVGAMRWAVNVTNANTHRISTNLNGLQDQFDRDAATVAHLRHTPHEDDGKPGKSAKPVSNAEGGPSSSRDEK